MSDEKEPEIAPDGPTRDTRGNVKKRPRYRSGAVAPRRKSGAAVVDGDSAAESLKHGDDKHGDDKHGDPHGAQDEESVQLKDAMAAATVDTKSPIARGGGRPFHANNGVLDGRYRLIKSLGEGGMAEVYLAEDLLLRRQVALKRLETSDRTAIAELELFRKEAAVTHAITHPNVARTYDIGDSDGVHYISMELLEGETLMTRIRRKPLTAAECRAIAVPLCKGLRAAHQAGIVHRDLKPANVMLVNDERHVVVMDFGIAGQAGSVSDGAAPTEDYSASPWGVTSAGRGTPAYMAPEQWRQESGDERTDIYALGVILYVALTCKSPFPARTIEELESHHETTPPPDVSAIAEGVDKELARLIQRCMAKRPGDRPANMDEVLDGIANPGRRRRWARNVALAMAVSALLLAGVFAGIFELAKSALLHEVRPAVTRLARLAASDLDASVLATFRDPAVMKTPQFRAVVEKMKACAQDSADIKACYVLRKTAKRGVFIFVADDKPLDEDDNGDGTIQPREEGSPVGLEYDGNDYPAMLQTAEGGGPQSDKKFAADQWGLALSGYAPILTADGKATDMFLGVDAGNLQLDGLRTRLETFLSLAFVFLVLAFGWFTFPLRGTTTRWQRLTKRLASGVWEDSNQS